MEDSRKDTNIHIGMRLRETRNNLGRKQAEFTCSIGVSEKHYSKYESGATGVING